MLLSAFQVFVANTDSTGIVINDLKEPISVLEIRIHPAGSNIGLRVEFYGIPGAF